MKEYQDACKRGDEKVSAIAEHAWQQHHPIEWEDVRVVDRANINIFPAFAFLCSSCYITSFSSCYTKWQTYLGSEFHRCQPQGEDTGFKADGLTLPILFGS